MVREGRAGPGRHFDDLESGCRTGRVPMSTRGGHRLYPPAGPKRLRALAVSMGVSGLVLAGMAAAQPAKPRPLAERTVCESLSEPDWTAAERWVWRRSCDGRLADLQTLAEAYPDAAPPVNAGRAAPDPDDSVLRASFLETILLRAPYRDALRPRGLHVHGAVIRGRLDLSNARLDFPLYLEHSRFGNAVILRDLRSTSFVELAGSRFEADVDMQRVRIENGLLSEDAAFAGVTLHGAEIGGQLLLDGASFRSPLVLESARVARDVLMRGTRLQSLRLVGARIEGVLLMADAEAAGRVDADSLDLAQSLLLTKARLHELNLSTARIRGKILGRGLEVEGALEADGIVTAGWVDLTDARAASVDLSSGRIGGWLSLSKAEVAGTANLDSLQSAGSVRFRGALLESVDLDFADIAGEADFSGARVEGAFGLHGAVIGRGLSLEEGSRIGGRTDLERVRIRGNLIVRHHEQSGELSFLGTQVDGQMAIENSHFEKGLDLDSTRIGESLFLNGRRPLVSLSLRGVEIGGQLDMTDQHVVERLVVHEVHVADSLYLRNVVGPHLTRTGARCGAQGNGEREASVRDTQIGGDLDLSGSRLSCLDLSGSAVGGSLQLHSEERGPVRWHGASRLMLRDLRVGTVDDGVDLGSWPAHLDLAGFRFTRFARLAGPADAAPGERSTEWYRAWLARSAYSAQSYQRLADYLRRGGRVEDANDILFAGRERYRVERAGGLEWVQLTLLKAVIGYGYGHKIFYSLIWVLLFMSIGAAVVWANGEGSRRGAPWTLVYSLDHLLPIVRLDERNYNLELQGAARYYFYLHTLVGYVLASFVVAGLAGLTE